MWVLTSATVDQFDVDDASLVDHITGQRHSADSFAVGFRTVWVGAAPGMARIDPIDGDFLRPVRVYAPGTNEHNQRLQGRRR